MLRLKIFYCNVQLLVNLKLVKVCSEMWNTIVYFCLLTDLNTLFDMICTRNIMILCIILWPVVSLCFKAMLYYIRIVRNYLLLRLDLQYLVSIHQHRYEYVSYSTQGRCLIGCFINWAAHLHKRADVYPWEILNRLHHTLAFIDTMPFF